MITDFKRIDECIDRLRDILSVLSAELEQRAPQAVQLPTDAKLCKESMMSINVLLPKLEQTRTALVETSTEPTLEELAPRYGLCADCDDE